MSRYTLWRQAALWGAAAVLAACSHTHSSRQPGPWRAADPDTEAVFHSRGRLAVKREDKGSYAHFEWHNGRRVQHIDVNTPLGNTVGVLCRDAAGLIAAGSDGRQYRAADAEELSGQLLGFALPLDYLPLWASGFWAPGVGHEILPDGRLRQSGWLIERRLAADGHTPRLLVLENRQLNIRLVFDRFEPVAENDETAADCGIRRNGAASAAVSALAVPT